jgi:hypothetical protein
MYQFLLKIPKMPKIKKPTHDLIYGNEKGVCR